MKNLRLLYPFAFAALLAGCGGDNGSNSTPSPFAGSYGGTYESTSTDNGDHGTVAVTVARDGTITGTATDSRYGNNGVVGETSRIRNGGAVVLNLGFASGGAGQSTTFQGTLTIESANSLTGTLNEQQGDFSVPFTFTLTRDN